MATKNTINCDSAGVISYDGAGVFTGTITTNHAVQVGNASGSLTSVTPSATSGIPIISQGIFSDPIFGAAVVAGGGTGAVSLTGVLTGNGTSAITANTVTQYGVLLGGSANAVASTAVGSAGQVLQSSGAGVNPAYSTATYPSTASSSGKILIANGTNWVASTPTYPNASVTAGKIIISDGTNYIASTPTYPNTSGTAGKVVISDGTNNVYSTPTFPNASATSGKIIKSDGTNWTASTETYAAPGTSGNVLTSDGTNWTSAAPTSTFAPNSIYNLVDDFYSPNINSFTQSFLFSEIPWVNSGSGMAYVVASEAAHPGVIGNVSTTTRAGIITTAGSTSGTTATPIILGGGTFSINWVVKVAALSTVTNRYVLYCGLMDINSAEPTNGVYMLYSDNVNSGKWVGRTASASSRNDVNDTGSAVTTAWYNVGMTVNAAASSVNFFVNGSSIGTQTLTIPTAAIGISTNIIRSAGTIATSSILVDLMYMTFTATTPR